MHKQHECGYKKHKCMHEEHVCYADDHFKLRDTCQVTIDRPIEMVYDYMTTPWYWPIYFSNSLKIETKTPTTPHPLKLDEKFVETAGVWLFKQKVHWTGSIIEPPNLFVVDGWTDDMGGGAAKIIYSFEKEGNSTLWKRTMIYTEHAFFMKVMCILFMDNVLKKAAENGMKKGKALMESMPC